MANASYSTKSVSRLTSSSSVKSVADMHARKPSSSMSERVALWNTVWHRKISGMAAPLRMNIHKYLQTHPDVEVYVDQDKHVYTARQHAALKRKRETSLHRRVEKKRKNRNKKKNERKNVMNNKKKVTGLDRVDVQDYGNLKVAHAISKGELREEQDGKLKMNRGSVEKERRVRWSDARPELKEMENAAEVFTAKVGTGMRRALRPGARMISRADECVEVDDVQDVQVVSDVGGADYGTDVEDGGVSSDDTPCDVPSLHEMPLLKLFGSSSGIDVAGASGIMGRAEKMGDDSGEDVGDDFATKVQKVWKSTLSIGRTTSRDRRTQMLLNRALDESGLTTGREVRMAQIVYAPVQHDDLPNDRDQGVCRDWALWPSARTVAQMLGDMRAG